MDLSYGADAERFRAEVRTFLARHWPPDDAGGNRLVGVKAFRAEAVAAGYLYRGVPARYGGSEQPPDLVRARIVREEFGRVRAPMEIAGNGTAMLVPTLIEHGAERQRERFIRPTIEGEIEWAQGYSEPGSGSDLASVRTRAELVGEEWIVNGQKIWTTFGDRADYMFALVRTELDAPRHRNLSYLLIDMRQPGVTVRPLRQMTGESRFSEVFLDDARTPADWIVGKRGDGWAVSRATLKHERASIGSAERGEELFAKLVDLARTTQRGSATAIEDREIRQRLAVIEGWVMAQKYSGYRQFSLAAAGHEAPLIGQMNKLLTTEIGHLVAALAQELIGEEALRAIVAPRPGERRGAEKWLGQIIGSLGVAIAGGTSNIQRNVIAERGLGLPRAEEGAA